MGKETKALKGVKMETTVAISLREKFNRQSKKMNTSSAQRLRDFMQKETKNVKTPAKAAKRK